jgi:hypothetical protein
MGYFMMLPVPVLALNGSMNDELESIWKEAVKA